MTINHKLLKNDKVVSNPFQNIATAIATAAKAPIPASARPADPGLDVEVDAPAVVDVAGAAVVEVAAADVDEGAAELEAAAALTVICPFMPKRASDE